MINKIHENRKLIHQIITIFTVFVLGVGVIVLSGNFFGRKSDLDYKGNLDKTAIKINDEIITLREFAYYVMDVEEFVNIEAVAYNPKDPLDYWDTHFTAGKNSSFIYAIAKEQAYESCVTDYLYSMEAEKNNFYLTDVEKSEARTEAEDMYGQMTEKQLINTGLSKDDMIIMKTREKLALKYASYLAQNTDWTYTVNSPSTELSYNGSYFKNNILDKYTIKKGKLYKQIILGKITIN